MLDIAQSTTLVNENKVKYHMIRRLQQFLIENGFCIYGGYVRDMMIHDYYATKFYKKSGIYTDLYSDENFLPEYKGRLVVPKDIDCFFNGTTKDVMECIKKLTKKGFDVDNDFGDCRVYPKFEGVELVSTKIRLSNYTMLGLRHVFVTIDICHGTNIGLKPPFGKLDILCNAFLFTKNGIQISDNTGTFLDECDVFERKLFELKIIKDMLSFKTKIAETIFNPMFQDAKNINTLQFSENLKSGMSQILTTEGFYRVSKMVNRGWEVYMSLGQVESVFNQGESVDSPKVSDLEESSEIYNHKDVHISFPVFNIFSK
jgi:hypothetical protein